MKRFLTSLRELHECERGAEGLEKLLIIAAIVLPVLGLLIYFKDFITGWVAGDTADIKGKADAYNPNVFPVP